MSFFGFDDNRHNTGAIGFSQAHNPFAGLSSQQDDDGDALEFEETYDGLGDQLEETNDAFNDDTFGDNAGAVSGNAGQDFDFFGQTAKVSNVIEEEHFLFNRQQPPARAAQANNAQPSYQSYNQQAASSYGYPSQPQGSGSKAPGYSTGYEKYAELQADADLWGLAPKKQPQAPAPQASPVAPSPVPAAANAVPASRKVLSLEEVEAQMRAQSKSVQKQPAAPSPAPQAQAPPQVPYMDPAIQFAQPAQHQFSGPGDHHAQQAPVTILQRPQSKHAPSPQPPAQPPSQSPALQSQHQRQQSSVPVQPTQILQNPNRLSGDAARMGPQHSTPPVPGPFPPHPNHRHQGSFGRQAGVITHPSQLAQLSDEEKAAYMEQEAKRAKRNHKIFLMSRDNGIMTPQDKSFVTRIQLQQLVAATGNPNEHGTDESLAEDFYYQVHNQIQGGQRQHPSQPLNNFAQTYLFQTGSRQGGMRRHNRGPENHMQRMEQQVQRAVEAAKNKPKNKQLVIEGSLGKISFSNAKTPKPLLNIKRNDSSSDANRPGSAHRPITGGDRKSELRCIESVYTTLMQMEDHDRIMPPPPSSDNDTEAINNFMAWSSEAQALNQKLWTSLRIHDHPEPGYVHPFIAFLGYSKGKKAMVRIFRHLTQEQRTTILTLIVVNLDNLDVVRNAQVTPAAVQLNAAMRENVELFSVAVMSTLFNFLNELELDLVTGVLGLVCTRNVEIIVKSRIGASMITMILSRAEIIKHNGGGSEQSWRAWESTYTQFFDLIEPTLPQMFPGPVTSGDDVYVWQLLAALGIGAGPDQQQRLVLAVKDRVMDTVALSKTLPQDMGAQRLQNVNLFMRSIGLDVELLQ